MVNSHVNETQTLVLSLDRLSKDSKQGIAHAQCIAPYIMSPVWENEDALQSHVCLNALTIVWLVCRQREKDGSSNRPACR